MKIFAHRGYSGCYPENTMLAFHKAVETGCDGIELDVQLTKDGTVVIIHDEKLDRTTTGCGSVKDFTYDEIRTLDAAKAWNGKFHKELIPSFEEYCEWAATTPLVTNIEFKTSKVYYPDIEKKTIEIIAKHGLEKKVLFSSFNHLSILEAKKIAPSIPVGAIGEKQGFASAGAYCKHWGFEFYHPSHKSLNNAAIKELNDNGIGTNVWNINGMAELEKMVEWNVAGIFTNFPNICQAYVS